MDFTTLHPVLTKFIINYILINFFIIFKRKMKIVYSFEKSHLE